LGNVFVVIQADLMGFVTFTFKGFKYEVMYVKWWNIGPTLCICRYSCYM